MKKISSSPRVTDGLTTPYGVAIPNMSKSLPQLFDAYINGDDFQTRRLMGVDDDLDEPLEYDTDVCDRPSKYQSNDGDLAHLRQSLSDAQAGLAQTMSHAQRQQATQERSNVAPSDESERTTA